MLTAFVEYVKEERIIYVDCEQLTIGAKDEVILRTKNQVYACTLTPVIPDSPLLVTTNADIAK